MITVTTIRIAAIIIDAVLVITLGLFLIKIIRQIREHNVEN